MIHGAEFLLWMYGFQQPCQEYHFGCFLRGASIIVAISLAL